MKQRIKQLKIRADDRFGLTSRFIQFGIIGASGVVVNMAVVRLCTIGSLPLRLSLLLGILVSMHTNFYLNRRVTFHDARRDSLFRQWGLFVASTCIGNGVNYVTSVWCAENTPWGAAWPELAVLVGVLAGMIFNFSMSRVIVFRGS